MSNTFLQPADAARYNMLKGPNGLRAGWRLLIFPAILLPLGYAANRIIDSVMEKLHADFFTPLGGTIILGGLASTLLLTAWIMARIEGRSLADYGLPWRRAFCLQFWQGAAFSLASLSALLLVLRLSSAFSFGSLALQGVDIWKYAVAWTVPLFLSALLEDFFYRGYLLFTLTTGIGFWPAALVTSLLMGGAHYFNPGGHGLGRGHPLLFGNLPGAQKDRRPLDAARNPLGLELGRGFLLRSAFQRTSRAREPFECQLPRPGVAHRWGIRTGGELAQYRPARDLVVYLLGLAARSEIPEPCRDPGSPCAYSGSEDSVLIMTRRSL